VKRLSKGHPLLRFSDTIVRLGNYGRSKREANLTRLPSRKPLAPGHDHGDWRREEQANLGIKYHLQFEKKKRGYGEGEGIRSRLPAFTLD